MSTVADYAGRTVDLLAYQGVRSDREALLVPSLAAEGAGGAVCTGAQKLAQRWVLEFLTERGTMAYLPTRGTDFVSNLRRGQLRTTLDAEQAFFLCNDQARSNLAAEEKAGTPDDESLDRVDLLSLTVSGDKLTVHAEVFSRAGRSRKVILPIAVRVG